MAGQTMSVIFFSCSGLPNIFPPSTLQAMLSSAASTSSPNAATTCECAVEPGS
jgi:hypothetical protein